MCVWESYSSHEMSTCGSIYCSGALIFSALLENEVVWKQLVNPIFEKLIAFFRLQIHFFSSVILTVSVLPFSWRYSPIWSIIVGGKCFTILRTGSQTWYTLPLKKYIGYISTFISSSLTARLHTVFLSPWLFLARFSLMLCYIQHKVY